MTKQPVPQYFGRNGLGRFVGVSDTRIGQMNPQADATVDGRPVWSLETAIRLKREREARVAHRGAQAARKLQASSRGEAAV